MRPLEQHIFCLDCLAELPETGFHHYRSNPFTARFAGRIELKAGASFLYFSRGGGTQRLLHEVKYHNRPDLITVIGKWYAKQLLGAEAWSGIDIILPVPLHWKKQRKRGYNQSAVFGDALGEAMKIPSHHHALARLTHDQSLTGMKRLERVETVGASFAVARPQLIQQKNILLVDDVLTTGATLEACAIALLRAQAASIRMATIACGEL